MLALLLSLQLHKEVRTLLRDKGRLSWEESETNQLALVSIAEVQTIRGATAKS